MPKICLTEEQRRKARYERNQRALADGMAIVKNRTKATNKDMARELGINHETLAKILGAEDVRIGVLTLFRLLDVAGLEIKHKEAIQ